ncbi:MAG TPA: DUF4349 domain-containing protein [Pseudonocardia sp.]|nr:DUF4349 domain-containing protein [Pseudonocardia sp.]
MAGVRRLGRQGLQGRLPGRRGVVALVALAVVLLAAIVVAAVAGVGARPDADVSGPGVSSEFPGGALPEPAPGDGAELRVPGAVGGDAMGGAVGGDTAVSPPAPAEQPPVPVGRDVVRSAQLRVEVADAPAAARQVRTAAAAVDGFVAEEQADRTGAWLVLRVPADRLDRLVEQISGIGTVVEQSGQVQDVTEQVVDLDARVATQQASVARVRALLAEAESIGDVVAVEAELARREAELESLTSRLAALRDQVALSTLTVDLQGPAEPGGDDTDGPGFLDGLRTGADWLVAIGAGVAAAAGFLLPFLPVLAVLALVGWAVRRARRRRRAARPADTAPE